MDLAELNRVAKAMVAPGKGILAADESGGTIKKRFTAIGVDSTETSRRDYRELLFRSSTAMADRISGVILFDETIRQQAADGTPLVKVIEQALAVNRPNANDAMDVLHKVGGLEIAGLAGVMIAAAGRRIPVIVDGFISTAAALIAVGLAPRVRDYLVSAHQSVEIGHQVMLQHLNLSPLLDMNMRLGEGTGAALAFHLIEASTRILREMATFGEAGVSDKE